MISTRRKFLETAALGAVGAAITSKPALADVPSTRRAVPPQELGDRFDPWIEVEANALANNVAEVRRLTANRPILAVIKNNAYGLDLTTAAALLEPMPEVAGLAVVKAEAALTLKQAGVRKPVYLMALFPESLAPDLARLGVRPCLYSDDALRLVEPMVRTVGGPIEAEVYLDTGMSRMGIPYHKALSWIESVVDSGKVRVGGVFMGFTEDPEYDKEQLRRFMSVARQASDAGFPLGTLHAASSSAVFELPESHLDMVRPGMALYGGYPNDAALQRERASLRSALRLKARVVRVERLRTGDSVSYGRNYVAQEPTWVATLPVGHADGLPGHRRGVGESHHRGVGTRTDRGSGRRGHPTGSRCPGGRPELAVGTDRRFNLRHLHAPESAATTGGGLDRPQQAPSLASSAGEISAWT
jgi:alanine racemase